MAEVSNTPWNEMHCYVLNPRTKGIKAKVREAPGLDPMSSFVMLSFCLVD